MTTYNTYQEAKIANPECNVWHLNGMLFASENQADVPSGAWEECNPADYCMTVEKFLTDGHRFVEGDVFINSLGEVNILTSNETWVSNLNNSEASKLNGERYILRAAALEDKQESQHDMQESQGNSHQQLMETLNDACGIFGCIPSYLIKNIEGLMATNKEYAKALSGNASLEEKPRTKVEYVKCEFDSAWEAVKAFEDGEVFHTHFMTDGWVIVEHVQQVIPNLQVEKLYLRIETPMTEREEFVEALNDLFHSHTMSTSDLFNAIVDSGKFKLVN